LTLDEARLDGSHRDHQLRLADGQVIKLAKARNGEPEVARPAPVDGAHLVAVAVDAGLKGVREAPVALLRGGGVLTTPISRFTQGATPIALRFGAGPSTGAPFTPPVLSCWPQMLRGLPRSSWFWPRSTPRRPDRLLMAADVGRELAGPGFPFSPLALPLQVFGAPHLAGVGAAVSLRLRRKPGLEVCIEDLDAAPKLGCLEPAVADLVV